MKKLIISSVLGIMVAASTAFGQGYIIFGASTTSVWDPSSANTTTGAIPFGGTQDDFALLFAPSTVTTALVDSILASVPTNNTAASVNGGAYSYSAAWNDITTDPNFTITQSNGVQAVASGVKNGGYNFNGGVIFPASNLAASTTYSMFVIGWNTGGGVNTTVAEALAANSPVGWSQVFQYTSVVAPPTGSETAGAGAGNKFGIGYVPVPEPTTLALAGLGGISMLFLRRRKA
jgi:PEP-CTERM motif